METPKNTGITRLFKATGYSLAGLAAAFRHEAAFRLEVFIAVIGIPLAFLVHASSVERVILIGSLLLMLIVELLNSAIEAIVDRISTERHPLSKRAKDVGSAAVFVAAVNAACCWVIILGKF